MRAILDIVDSVTGTVRFIVGLIALFIFAFVLITMAGASYMAPKISEDATQKAAAFGEKALAEARQQRREHELAKDGWGYGSAEPAQGSMSARGSSRSGSRDNFSSDGWGDSAQ